MEAWKETSPLLRSRARSTGVKITILPFLTKSAAELVQIAAVSVS